MIAPTVHLNGTSGEELLSQLEAAVRAAQAAITACYGAAPNARDYQVADGGRAFSEARDTNERHVRTLMSVRDDLQASYDHVQRQIDEREERKKWRK